MGEFFAIVSGPCGEELKSVFGTNRVEVTAPAPVWAEVGQEQRYVYLLKLDALSDEQLNRLVRHLVNKYECTAAEVEQELGDRGMPILATDCVIEIRKLRL